VTPLLILFDIDRTLVDVGPLHDRAYDSILSSFGEKRVTIGDLRKAGKTTPNILRELCSLAGLSKVAAEQELPELLRTFNGAVLGGMAVDWRPRSMPGVADLLACLGERGHLLGVLTGNPPEVGREVLRRAGLLEHFRAFAFGTDARERWQLVRVAAERARACLGEEVPLQRIVVVGDTPHDVEAGRRAGARTVLVGTGEEPIDEDSVRAADLFLPDFGDASAACAAICGLARQPRPSQQA
jgi:phosphoglycolate phosphatase